MSKCKNCGIEYESKRNDQLFCSSKCKLSYFRSMKRITNETDKLTKSETDNETDKSELGKCRYCGKIATAEEYGNNYELIECCYECSEKRRKGKIAYKPTAREVRTMDAKTLYAYIGAYEHDTWKDSPEFRELKERLKKPVQWLRKNGYWVPSKLEPCRA